MSRVQYQQECRSPDAFRLTESPILHCTRTSAQPPQKQASSHPRASRGNSSRQLPFPRGYARLAVGRNLPHTPRPAYARCGTIGKVVSCGERCDSDPHFGYTLRGLDKISSFGRWLLMWPAGQARVCWVQIGSWGFVLSIGDGRWEPASADMRDIPGDSTPAILH